MRFLHTVALVTLLASASATASPESSPPTASSVQTNIAQLEQQQAELMKKLKSDLAGMEESSRKRELQRHLAEIERRTQGASNLYVSPASQMTPEMKIFFEGTMRRLEDCGTRHFPSRDGKKLYGKGVLGLTVARSGALEQVEIMESSKNRLLDKHMLKVVRASAPFGPPPAQPVIDGSTTYHHLVLVTRFHFNKDDAPPPEDLPEKERCRWK